MRIAQLASSVESVPPAGYGGTELVISNLTEELVKRGHQVTLFASGDSQTSAELVSVCPIALRKVAEAARRWSAYDINTLIKLKKMRDQFDIVHNHMGWQALPYLAELGLPTVTTNHNPIKPYCAPIFLEHAHLPYVAISEAYRRANYPDRLNYVATVYNGIDTKAFARVAGGDTRREYLLFIGRVCEDKGTDRAIEIARRVDLPIVVAGKIDVADQDYFEQRVKPLLNTAKVRFIGEVNHDQKVDLYNGAIATVYPVNFNEPFGLVMAESLAAGTPVLALDRGAVREVLSDGETAIIGNSVDELVNRFNEIDRICAEACRERVSALFSRRRMVDAYERVYAQLVGEAMQALLDLVDAALSTPHWLLALDRDGTLVALANRPELATIDPRVVDLLQSLAAQPGFDVAVLSARSCAQLKGDFPAPELILAGNYGMEIRFPSGKYLVASKARTRVPELKLFRDKLAVAVGLHDGAILEDHGYSLCLHWRNVPPQRSKDIHRAVETLAQQFPELTVRELSTSHEVLADGNFNKGTAMDVIASNLQPTEKRFFLFAGDSAADAPAFEWITTHGGMSLRIGGSESMGATFQLSAPEDLHRLLRHILRKRLKMSAA